MAIYINTIYFYIVIYEVLFQLMHRHNGCKHPTLISMTDLVALMQPNASKFLRDNGKHFTLMTHTTGAYI